MLKDKELGEAIRAAVKLKGVTAADVARRYGIKPPSVNGWFNTGRISKPKMMDLMRWLSDVVGPEHWGLPIEGKQETSTGGRELVRELCEMAETINDVGLKKLISHAEDIARLYPSGKNKPQSKQIAA